VFNTQGFLGHKNEIYSFNNSNTNEDIVTEFEQGQVSCVRNEEECVCSAPDCCDTERRSASQSGSVASGTTSTIHVLCCIVLNYYYLLQHNHPE
jgi:hypothetical protein